MRRDGETPILMVGDAPRLVWRYTVKDSGLNWGVWDETPCCATFSCQSIRLLGCTQ